MNHSQIFPSAMCFTRPESVTVWTQSDYDIVQSLAIRVRIMTVSQASNIWWPRQQSPGRARSHLVQLVDAGLVQRYIINAHPLLEPLTPLANWQPGQPAPDAHALSTAARQRWNRPAIPVEVFVASKQAANLFGSDARGLPRLEQRDHDLLLSDAYVVYRQCRGESNRWIGEDFLPKAGFRIKDPDAFLVDDLGRLTHVIESAGRYSSKQIANFHDHCDSLRLSYELW